jgi:cell division septal protein FtsQ
MRKLRYLSKRSSFRSYIARLKFVSVAVFLVIIPLTILYLPNLIVIDKIDCFNQYDRCSSQVSDKIALVQSNKYGSAKKYIEKVLSHDMLVKSYSIHFQFPSMLIVNVIERKPKFALRSSTVQGIATIDDEGYVLTVVDESSLPTVVMSGTLPNPADKVDEQTLFGLRIVYNMSSIYKLGSAELKSDQLDVKLENGKLVVFPVRGDMQYLLGAMNMLLLRLNNPSSDTKIVNVNYIDLRYKNPVLKQI